MTLRWETNRHKMIRGPCVFVWFVGVGDGRVCYVLLAPSGAPDVCIVGFVSVCDGVAIFIYIYIYI